MKKYLIVKTVCLVCLAKIALAKSPTLANNRAIDSQTNQIILAQQSELQTQIRQLTEEWIDGWSPGKQPFDVTSTWFDQNEFITSQKARQKLGWTPQHLGVIDEIETYYAAWQAVRSS